MKKLCLIMILLITACGGSEQTADQPQAGNTCLQLEVAVGEGFKVDGEATELDQIGDALSRALEAGNRTAVVDVTCGEGVTIVSLRQLHEALTAQELYRVQYLRAPDPPIPFMLPNPDMAAQLADLPAESRCVVALGVNGAAMIEGDTFSSAAVVETLARNPEVVFVLAATDDVAYSDFVRILGELTGAGAQRISIQIVAS
jgi:biopolymer transport protein ExbD